MPACPEDRGPHRELAAEQREERPPDVVQRERRHRDQDQEREHQADAGAVEEVGGGRQEALHGATIFAQGPERYAIAAAARSRITNHAGAGIMCWRGELMRRHR